MRDQIGNFINEKTDVERTFTAIISRLGMPIKDVGEFKIYNTEQLVESVLNYIKAILPNTQINLKSDPRNRNKQINILTGRIPTSIDLRFDYSNANHNLHISKEIYRIRNEITKSNYKFMLKSP
jgi:hypothetical protein